jgi:predicted nucleic-acid-binding protein
MRTATERYAIDTNVIIRFLTHDHEEHWAKAHALMKQMTEGKIVLVCDPVVLGEVVWVLKSFYKLAAEEVCGLVKPIVMAEGLHIPDKHRYLKALALYGVSTSDFGDACLCAAALEHCEGRVLSFDRGIPTVEGISRTDSV